jgi:nucleoside-diphosphate-sugar epimerase
MKCLVTGAAGFIGSHLARALIERGDQVVGVDCFDEYYERSLKEKAVADLREAAGFELLEANLNQLDLGALLGRVEVVFHLAAQPGVRGSWGPRFRTYVDNNILATQRLLEAVKDQAPRVRVVFAGSSSVYGNAPDHPTSELTTPQPVSPYGVTKLAAEHLVRLYHVEHGLSTVSLRYFTVFGPGQRPDMAFHKFIKAGLTGEPIIVFGDGRQSRDFTFVGDTVRATLAAAESGAWGQVFNVGGGHRVTINQVLDELSSLLGRRLDVHYQAQVKGDVRDTEADISLAQARLGYSPRTGLSEGLSREAAWIQESILK